MTDFTRRDFLKASSVAALGAGVGLAQAGAFAAGRSRKVSANEKVVLGFIGVAGRGNRRISGTL